MIAMSRSPWKEWNTWYGCILVGAFNHRVKKSVLSQNKCLTLSYNWINPLNHNSTNKFSHFLHCSMCHCWVFWKKYFATEICINVHCIIIFQVNVIINYVVVHFIFRHSHYLTEERLICSRAWIPNPDPNKPLRMVTMMIRKIASRPFNGKQMFTGTFAE